MARVRDVAAAVVTRRRDVAIAAARHVHLAMEGRGYAQLQRHRRAECGVGVHAAAGGEQLFGQQIQGLP